MKISQNFALAIRPCYLNFGVDNVTYLWHAKKGSTRLSAYDRTGRKNMSEEVTSEREAWETMSRRAPEFMDALRASERPYHQGLQLRGELMLDSPDRLAEMEVDFATQMLGIHAVIMESLGLNLRGKKLVPRRSSTSRGVCFWQITANVVVPHLGTAPSRSVVRLFPSVTDERTWSIQVSLPAATIAHLIENQSRIQDAFRRLSEMGIQVADVSQGSCLLL